MRHKQGSSCMSEKKTSWSVSDFVVLLLGFASTFYEIRWFRARSFLLPGIGELNCKDKEGLLE